MKTDSESTPPLDSGARDGKAAWSYDVAFSRNRGLINPQEQQKLRRSRVAIAGLGGVGGIHLVTLTRLGIGAFHIADPDRFAVVNFNRQYGATTRSMGHSKAEVMAGEARAINPELELRVFDQAINPANVDAFLEGVDVFVDGIDFFALDARRLLFGRARERGIWAVTAGPVGFSTAWLSFAPGGMSFDEYFDLHDNMDAVDQLVAFAAGLAPGGTHLSYIDLSSVNPATGSAPSAGLACQLSAGVMCAEVLKILLGRGTVRAAPWYGQFDPYRRLFRQRRLWRGNRHPLQRLKRWLLTRHFRKLLQPGAKAGD
jgi:molybdopterin/thiamine biosynthesis adenylyltransferase